MSIPSAEYRQRLEALSQRLAETPLDVLVVSSFDSIYYLTGAGFEPLERPFFLLVRPRESPVLLVPKLDAEHMRKACNVDDDRLRTYWDHPAAADRSWPHRLREELGDARVVGVEPSLPRAVADELGGVETHTSSLVDNLRLVKSPAEITMIRRASRYADFGVERLIAASYSGSTVAEGYAETRTVAGRIVREVEDWDPLVSRVLMATWAAPRSAMPHSVPRLFDRLGNGPHVGLVLVRVNGYSAESERTYFTSPPAVDDRLAFAAMTEARRLALDRIRPGVSCAELDARTSEFLRGEGFGGDERRLHRIGHGIGLGTHEAPWLGEGGEGTLAEGMVVSIEPGIYLHGVGGYRHSDTVLVTADGHELLTRHPADLDSLTLGRWRPFARVRGTVVRRRMGVGRRRLGRDG